MKILVVIDMQNDFIDGALGTKEAVSIVGNVANKIKEYKDNGDVVIFTRDTHTEDYMNTQEGRRLPVVHCIKGSKGWEISEELDTKDAVIIDKPTFGSLDLANYIANNFEAEQIELIGICTDICVVSNSIIIKTMMPEVDVVVDSRCCAGVTPQTHNSALETMKMCQVDVR